MVENTQSKVDNLTLLAVAKTFVFKFVLIGVKFSLFSTMNCTYLGSYQGIILKNLISMPSDSVSSTTSCFCFGSAFLQGFANVPVVLLDKGRGFCVMKETSNSDKRNEISSSGQFEARNGESDDLTIKTEILISSSLLHLMKQVKIRKKNLTKAQD